MSRRKRVSWSALGCGLFLFGALFLIIRSKIDPPQTMSNAADAEKSKRLALPKAGLDERTTLVQGAWIAGNGIIEPADREIRLAAPTGGRIAEILIREGENVEAGAPLIRMDDEVQKAAVDVAEAELTVAQAELERTLRGLRKEEVDAAIAGAMEAKARADLAASTVQRVEKLIRSGATTQQELDRANRQAEADRAALEAAEARKKAALSGGRAEDILVARAKVKAAEARLAQARADLEQRMIRAPRAGKILQLKARPGELYSLNNPEPLLLLGDTQRLKARIDIDERDVGRLRPDAKGFVTLAAFPGRKIPGHVSEIGQRMGRKNVRTDDPTERIDTKILEVVLDLDEKEGLIPGLRVMGYLEAAAAPPRD